MATTFGKRLQELRTSKKMTQADLGRVLKISASTIGMYETDKRQPNFEIEEAIADFFNVDLDYLRGKQEFPLQTLSFGEKEKSPDILSGVDNIISFNNFKQILIIGTIACGEPILAEENLEGYTNIEIDIHADFALRCKGDSMSPKFSDGDIVLIRQQPDVENGQIAAVLINNEATLKRVYKNHDSVLLSPENLSYQPMVYTGEDLNNIRILGLAVGYTRIF